MATFDIYNDIENKLIDLKKINESKNVTKRLGAPRPALRPMVVQIPQPPQPPPPPTLLNVEKEKEIKKKEDAKTQSDHSELVECFLNKVKVGEQTVKPLFFPNNLLEQEYHQEILKYLLEKEKSSRIKSSYMRKQNHLNWNMRSVLIDWLADVGDEYKMCNQTLHLAINYIDSFLSYISVAREKFQLVGAASMMIAGKVEEIYPPTTKEWSNLTGDAFNIRQILKMEQLILKVLNFDINPPTILDFIRILCLQHNFDSKTRHLAMYLSELVLLEGDEYLKYFPSFLAAATLALARHTLKKEPWTKDLEKSTGYSMKQLSPIVQKQYKTFESSPRSDLKAIPNKYKSEKYEKVALLKPRVLAFDDDDDDDDDDDEEDFY